jgi:hypothetical protein
MHEPMPDCQACAEARERRSAMFHAGCTGCVARSAARSPQAFEARTKGRQTTAYRELLARLELTHEQVKAAREADFESTRVA